MPVSICTGLFNRSGMYINHFLESLQLAEHPELIELSVFDCGSTDNPNLEESIRKKWKGKLIFKSESLRFTRAHAFNRAIAQSTNELLFICDADLSLPNNIVQLCNDYTSDRTIWFPIFYYLFNPDKNDPDQPAGVWDIYGSKGMFAAFKSNFDTIGRFSDQFEQWGGEDTDLWKRFHQNGFIIIRNKQLGLVHHWHTTHNPKFMYMNG